MYEKVCGLLPEETLGLWDALTAEVEKLYDTDRLWNKGFGEWAVEYKYRRGGKSLCTFYAKEGAAAILITYGKAERDKFEDMKEEVSERIRDIYDATETLHDGKWIWIPLDGSLKFGDITAMLKIKRRPNRK